MRHQCTMTEYKFFFCKLKHRIWKSMQHLCKHVWAFLIHQPVSLPVYHKAKYINEKQLLPWLYSISFVPVLLFNRLMCKEMLHAQKEVVRNRCRHIYKSIKKSWLTTTLYWAAHCFGKHTGICIHAFSFCHIITNAMICETCMLWWFVWTISDKNVAM